MLQPLEILTRFVDIFLNIMTKYGTIFFKDYLTSPHSYETYMFPWSCHDVFTFSLWLALSLFK
ncbi:hypothetical protein NC653_022213 [Populus alba x Populus x berolinensis]|uniref:Uncharacterized protein n=1 Tax=Populus alba x Populus x berolinensis TaxID=444605 RepID=A0AAD6QFR9_9ROSI|nr:hypothetical protein NC653_022213 [Populus alba x Populus x berolinensis]